MRRTIRFLRTLIALLAFSTLAAAQNAPSEVEQLLDLLVAKNVLTSAEADQFRARLKKTATPPVSATEPAASSQTAPPPVAATQADPKGTSLSFKNVNISGFVQGRFTEARGTTNTFEIRRARLIFDGKLGDTIGYLIQIEGVKPQLLDARLDFKPLPQFGVSIGQFKIPFSTESITSDNLLPFIERSTVVNSFAPGRDNGSIGRDIGLQFSGKVLHGKNVDRLEYFVALFNGNGINVKDDNHYKDTAARVVLRPLRQLALMANYYNGATGVQQLSKERFGAEFSFAHGPITAAGEYIWGHDGPIHRNGWYALTALRLSQKWEGVFRFDNFSPHQHTPTLTTVNNYVMGANYYLNPFVKLAANFDRQEDLFTHRGSNIVLLQTQFQFGAERKRQ